MKKNITEYENIIWDWNGTLFNDVELCAGIMNDLLKSESLPTISLERYRNIFTFPVEEYYKAAGHTFKKNSFKVLGKRFMDEYEEKISGSILYPGAEPLLQYFYSIDAKQHLLSAYEQVSLERVINKFNIQKYFVNIVGLDNIYAGGKMKLGKMLMNMIRANGINESVLLIGDTMHDYEVSEEIGCDCILISDGHQAKDVLLEKEIMVLNNLEELYGMIDS